VASPNHEGLSCLKIGLFQLTESRKGRNEGETRFMKQKRTSLDQRSNKSALSFLEQDEVLPLISELEDAELDFVAGGKMNDMGGIHTTGYNMPPLLLVNSSPTSGARGPARPNQPFS
jgi:hypothetical protein